MLSIIEVFRWGYRAFAISPSVKTSSCLSIRCLRRPDILDTVNPQITLMTWFPQIPFVTFTHMHIHRKRPQSSQEGKSLTSHMSPVVTADAKCLITPWRNGGYKRGATECLKIRYNVMDWAWHSISESHPEHSSLVSLFALHHSGMDL